MNDRSGAFGTLIHIGAAKAASTWMQAEVFRNAALGFDELATRNEQKAFLVRPSRSEFDAVASRAFFAPLQKQALQKGLCPVVSVEALSGRSRVGDQNATEFADRLKRVFPDGKILYVVREQASMLRAQYLQYVRRGGHRSIQWFLDQNEQNGEASAYFRWDRFKYDALVRYHQDLFGPEQVLVLPLEMLASAPQAFVLRLLEFCGLPEKGAQHLLTAPAQRKSASGLSYALVRKLNLLFAVSDILNAQKVRPSKNAKANLIAATRLGDRILPVNWKRHYQQKINRLIAERLDDHYAASNSALENQTGLDLLPYGYALDR